MTCKDCIHYDVCKSSNGETEIYGVGLNCNAEKMCEHFKDKSRFIKLPCKVGESVWILDRENVPQKMVLENPYVVIRCTEEKEWCDKPCFSEGRKYCLQRLDVCRNDIGKTVFRTREEAETKLKEMSEK